MASVTNNVSGRVVPGLLIQGDNMNIAFTAGGTRVVHSEEPTPSPKPAGELNAFRTRINERGPRLAVLTKGEAGVAFGLLALATGVSGELDDAAGELASRISARLQEYGEGKRTAEAGPTTLRGQIDQPGPRLAVLTMGEAGVTFALLAMVTGLGRDLDGVAGELANRLSARLREHEA